MAVQFDSGDLARRARQGGETLARACAAQKGLHVIDATAGLGRDACLLLAAGAEVTAIEQQPVLAFWLRENLRSAGLKIPVLESPAEQVLGVQSCDVVYLDPMFPHREKSAAVGRESRVLQAFAPPPESTDEARLLDAAWASCRYRVVVKRPIKAPPLAGREPSASLKGKAVRFDIYGKQRLP